MTNIIFIHGVGDAKKHYSDILYKSIVREYKKLAIKNNDKVIRQCEIVWDDATSKLIEKYNKIKQKPKMRMQFRTLLGFFYHFIDPIVIQIMYYMKDKGDKKTGKMGILKKVHERFKYFHEKYGRVDIVVAHSLGSVIAFDYIFGFRRFKYSKRAKLKALITMGSPLPIFTTAMEHMESKLKLPANVGKWINILDEDDGIARHCKPFFKNIPIRQVKINTGRGPISAHVGYWKSREVAKVIANEIEKN